MTDIKRFFIEDLSSEGRGVGRELNGRVAMIKGALPGDTVSAEIDTPRTKAPLSGTVKDILDPSPHRQEHPCPHYRDGCAASPLGAFRHQAGMEWKKRHLRENLRRIGGLRESEITDPLPSPNTWGYRERLELRLFPQEGRLRPGYRGADWLVRVEDCLLADELFRQRLKALNRALAQESFPLMRMNSKDTPRLLLRCNGRDDVVAVIFVSADDKLEIDRLGKVLDRMKLAGWQIRRVRTMKSRFFKFDTVESAGDCRIWLDSPTGKKIAVDPAVFSQANAAAGKVLLNVVLNHLPSGGRIMDIYGGYGPFALRFAQRKEGKAVVVEASGEAVRAGQGYADINNLPVDYIKADLTRSFPQLKRRGKFEAAVLDPPRSGIHRRLADFLNAEGPRRLIYVSCHPAALARDLKRLKSYRPRQFIPLDLFPHTPELETVALLDRV